MLCRLPKDMCPTLPGFNLDSAGYASVEEIKKVSTLTEKKKTRVMLCCHVFHLTVDVSVRLVPDIVSAPHCTHKHTNTEKTNTSLHAT